MKNKIYLLLSVSASVFYIHQGFSGPDVCDWEIQSGAGGCNAQIDPEILNNPNLKATLVGLDVENLKGANIQASQATFNQNDLKKSTAVAAAPRVSDFSLEDVKQFAQIARASYTGHADQQRLIDDMTTQGYTVKNMTKTSERHAGLLFFKDNEVIVAYRGTEFNTDAGIFGDLATDINGMMMANPMGPGQIHKGFHAEFSRSDKNIFTSIYNYCVDNKIRMEDLKVKVTGHSLGAGLATLFTQAAMNRWGMKPENIHLVTFASPRVGNEEFAADFNKAMKDRTLRVNQKGKDLVTGVGPKQMGYAHVGTPLDLNVPEFGIASALTFETHFMDGYVGALNNLNDTTFKGREVVESNSQSYLGYIASAPVYAANGLLGGALKTLNWLDPTSYAPFALGFGYEANLPENRIPLAQVGNMIQKTLKELTMVSDELGDMIKKNVDKEEIFNMRLQEVKALKTVGVILERVENDPFVARSLTSDQKSLYNKVSPVYKNFEAQAQKTEAQAHKIDQLVAANELSLNAYESLASALADSKSSMSKTQMNDMEKMVKNAKKEYKKNQKNLETAREEMEGRIKNLDISKNKLMKIVTKHGHQLLK